MFVDLAHLLMIHALVERSSVVKISLEIQGYTWDLCKTTTKTSYMHFTVCEQWICSNFPH